MEERARVVGRPLARAVPGSPPMADTVVRGRIDRRDPFAALLRAWLDPTTPGSRWAVVLGSTADARAALDDAGRRRDRLVVRTGQADADALLADISPVLGTILAEMTPAQRRIAARILGEGLRQSEVADALGISRASVSVANRRGHVPEARLLLRAMRAAWNAGLRLRDGVASPSRLGCVDGR